MSTERKAFLKTLAKDALIGACVAIALYVMHRTGVF